MAQFSDNFNRPNSSLGANWLTPVAIPGAENVSGGASASVQLLSDAYAPLSTFAGLATSIIQKGGPFGNDQWAQASIAAIAPFTSVVAITAALRSGSNTTYTYTLSSGSALIMGQQMYITGMGHAGNNSTTGFLITGLGAGTFTVVNASGVTATENGTGTSPSDCNCGLVVRGSADGKTGYFLTVGTNSGQVGNGGTGSVDQRVYCIEIWKLVAGSTGVAYLIALGQPINVITDIVGDTYTFVARGGATTTLYLYHNGKLLTSVADASSPILSGTPGLMSWTVSGAGEWSNPTNYDTGAGNSGTQWSNWEGGDFTASTVPYFDNFVAANATDLNTYNSNWVENSGTFQIQGNAVTRNALVAGNCMASWQGATFANDQWAQITLAAVAGNSELGVAARVAVSGNTGYMYRTNAGNTRFLFRIVGGVFTNLATSNTAHTNVAGDTLRIAVIGSKIYCFLNGVLENFGVITDATPITSGFPGIQGANIVGTGTTGTAFQAGNACIAGNVDVAGVTVTLGGTGSGTTTSDSNGNYSFNSGIVDGTYTITPSLAGHTFTPAVLTVVVAGASLFPFGENTSSSHSIAENVVGSGAGFATQIKSPRTAIIGTNLGTRII